MTGGVTLAVRQISSYPEVGSAGPGDILLMQPGGLGNPYATIDAQTLVQTALADSSLGVGLGVPANANPGNVFAAVSAYALGGGLDWNVYYGPGNQHTYLENGIGGVFEFSPQSGWALDLAPPGIAGQPANNFSTMFSVGIAGNASLPFGTLTVARDPAGALEVATMGWVGNNTVASFNGRKGAVTLNGCDVYAALCLTDMIATEGWVNSQIQASIQMLLANHPFVFGWNGRTGVVYLTLADISCVFFQPGQQPITQTPPLTSNDYSIPNTAWVVEYLANEFAGAGGNLATQAWVLANTVNSFNGRQGAVTLTLADVTNVGAAPINSPNFSGIPTAPTAAFGQATGQIATTSFVQQAVAASVAGVSSFNTRTGAVVLTNGDISAAGGLSNPSANLTGAPTAPTAAPGTSSPQIANTQFVTSAINGAVTSFNTRTGAVVLLLSDITGVGGAPLASPTFTGTPAAPTANAGTNTTQIATTAFVTAAIATAGGVESFNGRTGVVDLEPNDISAAGGLVNPSVGLTGTPTAPTATTGTNTNQIATTAFVTQALSSGAVSSFNTRTGAVVLSTADITGAGGAPLANPTFTGTPAAPTATPGTNNTQLATTAFVNAAIAADTTGVTSFNTRVGAVTLTTADITAAGGAPIASPNFSGTPTAQTAAPGTSTTQLATTAFVNAAIAGSGVNSFNGRTGAVTLIGNDISAAGGALTVSPIFTGVPAGPTAAPGTSTTQLATTAFVSAAITAQGGPFLPLSGGATTGSVSIGTAAPANMQAGTLYGNAMFGTVYGLNTYLNTSAAWVRLNTQMPVTFTSSPSQFVISVAAAGTAGSVATGFVSGLQINPAGSVNTPGPLSVGTSGLFTMNETAAYRFWQFAGNYALQWNISSGVLSFQTPTASAFSCDPSGNFQVGATLNAPRLQITGGFPAIYYAGAASALFAYSASFYWVWNTTSGLLTWQGTTGSVSLDSAGNMNITGTLTQGSDATNKTNINPLTQGISLVKQLLPKSFAFNSTPSVTQWGFIAQDVQPVVPEAVSSHETVSGTPTLGLDITALLAVAINAIKQLDQRCAALEAAASITPPAGALA